MFLDDDELLHFAKRRWARLVVFYRSLNLHLKPLLIVYLLLLQVVVCLDRYGEVFTKAEFTAFEKWRNAISTDAITDLHFWKRYYKIDIQIKVFVDLLRPVLFVLLLGTRNNRIFYGSAFLLLIFFHYDSYLISVGMPQINDYSGFGYEWRHSPLFRLCIFNEVIIRLVVLFLVWQRFSAKDRVQPRSAWWHFSLGDLTLFILLIAATIAILR